MAKYKIKNPYENIADLIKNDNNHYKTNLHTHSTYSDANNTMSEMIDAFYDCDFDILAFAEHGVFGKPWDQDPAIIPLFLFQNLWHGKRRHPSTAEFQSILTGTHKTQKNSRSKKRGLMCVPNAIEANMFTLVKNHVNGYFTDNACEGIFGKENDYETPIKKIEQSGGVSHINHPTDWLESWKYPECGNDPKNIAFFADLLRRYRSCLGIEVLNMYDKPNRCDRQLWDSLLQVLIPEGERTVWGFSNSDAHETTQVDTAFMDFILPEFSQDNLRHAMENGSFFSIARYAKNELGENFEGKGITPRFTEVSTGEDTITLRGEICKELEWIADGKIIKSEKIDSQGEIISTINLNDYADKISCYVRAQIKGEGGICLTQPFICDDGNLERFKKPIVEPIKKHKFFNTRLGVIVERNILKR